MHSNRRPRITNENNKKNPTYINTKWTDVKVPAREVSKGDSGRHALFEVCKEKSRRKIMTKLNVNNSCVRLMMGSW